MRDEDHSHSADTNQIAGVQHRRHAMMKCPDSIIAHVRRPYYDAVKELREHGEIPCMFLTMKYDPARDEVDQVQTVAVYDLDTADKKDSAAQTIQERSEERRVGKEGR